MLSKSKEDSKHNNTICSLKNSNIVTLDSIDLNCNMSSEELFKEKIWREWSGGLVQ